jgi:hypothetical protein
MHQNTHKSSSHFNSLLLSLNRSADSIPLFHQQSNFPSQFAHSPNGLLFNPNLSFDTPPAYLELSKDNISHTSDYPAILLNCLPTLKDVACLSSSFLNGELSPLLVPLLVIVPLKLG